MSKIDEVRSAMQAAMKSQDKERKDALSLLLAALKYKFINKRADLTPDEENEVVLKEIKQAQESIDTAPADRTDVIAECTRRIEIYKEFAPQQMTEDEINQVIDQVLAQLELTAPTAKQKGLIMKTLMPLVKGKADSGLVNALLSKRFA